MKTKLFNRTVWLVCWVSLLTDISSEMLYPIMPFYLKHIGFSMLLIGLLEGLAEALAGLSKGYFGQRSDLMGQRLGFVRGGYLLSALSKPLLAVSPWVLWVFAARLLDRFGKGLRTAPRDALLASQATAATKGRIFGLHRGMDTLGATVGPCLALAFLALYPHQYSTLFVCAFLPALAGVGLTWVLREPLPAHQTVNPPQILMPWAYLRYWRQASPAYRRLVVPMLLFSLFNASDAFLLLRAKHLGVSETWVIALYIGYNLLYAILSLPIGALADRWGMRRSLQMGLLLFALVYLGFAWGPSWGGLLFFMGLYALYAAASESLVKAWISNLTPQDEQGVALGFYVSLASLSSLFASILAGLLWQYGSPVWPFVFSSVGALGVWFYFCWLGSRLPEPS